MNNLTKQGVNNIMRKFLFFLITFPVISIGACMDFYNQDLVTLQGKKFDLCKHQDKPIILDTHRSAVSASYHHCRRK